MNHQTCIKWFSKFNPKLYEKSQAIGINDQNNENVKVEKFIGENQMSVDAGAPVFTQNEKVSEFKRKLEDLRVKRLLYGDRYVVLLKKRR